MDCSFLLISVCLLLASGFTILEGLPVLQGSPTISELAWIPDHVPRSDLAVPAVRRVETPTRCDLSEAGLHTDHQGYD